MLTQQGRYFGETLNRFSLLLDHVASGASLDSIAGECAVPWLMEMINDNNIGAEIKSAAAIVGEKKSPKKKTIKKKRAANTKVKIKPIVDPASTAAEDEDYLEEDEQTTEAARSTDAERNWVHYVFH
jgi:hypothetical protein